MKMQSLTVSKLLLFSAFFATVPLHASALSFADLAPSTASEILGQTSLQKFAGILPLLKPLSSYSGTGDDCVETSESGVVCVGEDAIYIDDTLVLTEKEWSLKPPKTGIAFIDHNRDLIGGALSGGALASATGAVAGIFWVDRQQAQARIDELRRQNQSLQADLAQGKLDRVKEADAFKVENQKSVDANSCLRANDQIYKIAMDAFESYLGEFNQCLASIGESDSEGGTKAQGCLDTYEGKANAGLSAAKLFGNCN